MQYFKPHWHLPSTLPFSTFKNFYEVISAGIYFLKSSIAQVYKNTFLKVKSNIYVVLMANKGKKTKENLIRQKKKEGLKIHM